MKPRGLQPQAWALTRILRLFLRRLAKWRLFHVIVSGKEHVPQKDGAVIFGNHLSFGDPPVVWACLDRNVVAIAMK